MLRMLRKTMMAAAIGMAAMAAPAALAGEPPAAEVKPQKKKFNFEGDTISTDYLKPGTMLIEGVSRGRRSSLIEVRLDFVNEILRSADDI